MSNAGKWGYTTDEVNYTGAYDTPEEAARAGAIEEDMTVTVGQYREPTSPETCIHSVDSLIEQVWDHEDYSTDYAEGEFEPTNEQADDLKQAIKATMAAWLDRHDLRPTFSIVEEDSVRTIHVP